MKGYTLLREICHVGFSPLQPLFYAASKGHTSLLRLLVKKGADPKATCNQHETPASVAYASGNVAAADWLESISSSKKGDAGLTSDLPLLGSEDLTAISDTRYVPCR